jgi:peptidoglycan/LPS O-acetylase OafA/YrhL
MNSSFDAHQEFLARRHFGSLDGVRCLAIVAVLWHHSDIPSAASFHQLFARGFLGVDLFFVLSGFLIVTLLIRERARTGGISLQGFYMRRTLRICPPYYGLLFLLVFVYLVLPGLNTAAGFFDSLPYYLTYTSNWSLSQAANLAIAWSLATEEQFYIVWPAAERYLRSWQLYLTLIAVIVINQFINFGFLDGAFAWLYGLDAAPRLPILASTFTPIAFGVAVAHVLNRPNGFHIANRLLGHRHTSTVLLAALLTLMVWLPADLSGWPRLSIHILMAAWLTSLVVREDHSMHALLAAKPIAYVGAISYGIYLYHPWMFHVVRSGCNALRFQSDAGVFALKVAATIAFAAVSYKFYERPFLRLKERFARAG